MTIGPIEISVPNLWELLISTTPLNLYGWLFAGRELRLGLIVIPPIDLNPLQALKNLLESIWLLWQRIFGGPAGGRGPAPGEGAMPQLTRRDTNNGPTIVVNVNGNYILDNATAQNLAKNIGDQVMGRLRTNFQYVT